MKMIRFLIGFQCYNYYHFGSCDCEKEYISDVNDKYCMLDVVDISENEISDLPEIIENMNKNLYDNAFEYVEVIKEVKRYNI